MASTDLGNTILDWGKEHRGKPFKDVPIRYFDWMLGLDDLHPALRKKIVAYLKTQAEYDQFKSEVDASDQSWKEGREDAEDWRTM